jgi:hypothetical protein
VAFVSRVRIEDAGRDADHAMEGAGGDLFYPDDHEDARYLTDVHDARPVNPDRFPFHLAEPVVRARVTLTVEVSSALPLELTDTDMWAWVAGWFGRVCDASPHRLLLSGLDEEPERHQEVSLGTIHEGPVEWVDGSAPPTGWHCTHCRQPKRPDAGPCMKLVPFGGREYPCGIDDADHHGSCSFRPGGVA